MTIHASWRGVIGSFAGALVLLAVALFVLAVNGPEAFPVVLTAFGVVFVLVVALDYPIASTFTTDGVTRRALLRHHTIPWSRVKQLSRTRSSVLATRRDLVMGGLVAVVGRRKYLLADRPESAAEFDALVAMLDGHVAELDVLRRPADTTPPTWLYRRARWRPQD